MVVRHRRRIAVAIDERIELTGGLVAVAFHKPIRVRHGRQAAFGTVAELPLLSAEQVRRVNRRDLVRLCAPARDLGVPERRLIAECIRGDREPVVGVVRERLGGDAVRLHRDMARAVEGEARRAPHAVADARQVVRRGPGVVVRERIGHAVLHHRGRLAVGTPRVVDLARVVDAPLIGVRDADWVARRVAGDGLTWIGRCPIDKRDPPIRIIRERVDAIAACAAMRLPSP